MFAVLSVLMKDVIINFALVILGYASLYLCYSRVPIKLVLTLINSSNGSIYPSFHCCQSVGGRLARHCHVVHSVVNATSILANSSFKQPFILPHAFWLIFTLIMPTSSSRCERNMRKILKETELF